MGRQIQILLDEPDEQQLLARLRVDGEVRILQDFAPNPDALSVDELAADHGHRSSYIWPTRYAWSPTYGTTTAGSYYVLNKGIGPLVEYSRAPLDGSRPGRLYWARDFAGTPLYDVRAFDRWIQGLFRWIRRTGTRSAYAGVDPVWSFPAAATRLSAPREPAA